MAPIKSVSSSELKAVVASSDLEKCCEIKRSNGANVCMVGRLTYVRTPIHEHQEYMDMNRQRTPDPPHFDLVIFFLGDKNNTIAN